MSARPATARRARTLAGRRTMASNYEKAVSGPPWMLWHRLQPDALIGTLRCDPENAKPYPISGPTRWRHVGRVEAAERCAECWA